MALSEEQIYDIVTDWFADPWVIAPAIKMIKQAEAKVHEQDEALIQKLADALSVAILQNNCNMVMTGEELRQARSAIALGRARLDGKSHESST